MKVILQSTFLPTAAFTVHVVSNDSDSSISKSFGPCGTLLLPMNDHHNDIQHYTTLTIHVVSIDANRDLVKTYGPYGTLHKLKDHYIEMKLYIPLTLLVVSIDSDDSHFNNFQVIKSSLEFDCRFLLIAKILIAKCPIAKGSIAESPIAKIPIAECQIAKSLIAECPIAKSPFAECPIAKITIAQIHSSRWNTYTQKKILKTKVQFTK